MTLLRKRTTLHVRFFEWETPAKEFSVGKLMDGGRETSTREVALGGQVNVASRLESAVVIAREGNIRGGGSKGNQD